jgi:hypothetical protein
VTRHCTTYYDHYATLALIETLTLVIEWGGTCIELAEKVPFSDAVTAVCAVLHVDALFLRWWIMHVNKAGGYTGIHITVWYWRAVWWWFGVHHGPWIADWAWIYPKSNSRG